MAVPPSQRPGTFVHAGNPGAWTKGIARKRSFYFFPSHSRPRDADERRRANYYLFINLVAAPMCIGTPRITGTSGYCVYER